MANKHNKSKRKPRVVPYINVPCKKCGRPLCMKKGKVPKCPICDGTGARKPLEKKAK